MRLRHLLGPGRTFVDVGANWGYFTLLAATLTGPAGRIISLEHFGASASYKDLYQHFGITAYLLRKELLETIRVVHAGQKRIPPDVASQLAEHATDETLSAREIEVLRLVAGGNANKEIAARLSITEETVKGHIKNILAKLGANDRTHAVTIGLKRGIIDL